MPSFVTSVKRFVFVVNLPTPLFIRNFRRTRNSASLVTQSLPEATSEHNYDWKIDDEEEKDEVRKVAH